MSNSDLLIAQLQRRNRLMFGGILAGLAMLGIGLALVLLDTNIETAPVDKSKAQSAGSELTSPKPAIPETANQDTANQEPAANNTASTNSTPAPETAPAAPTNPDPAKSTDSPEDKQNFLRAMQAFNDTVKTEVTAFPDLAASPRYQQLIRQLEADLVSLTGQSRYKDASMVLANNAATIKTWMDDELDKFQQLIGNAEAAWQEKALTTLEGIIAKAGAVYSGYPKPLGHYRALAQDWPAVEAALTRANTARAENRPDDEKQALQDITRLTHDIDGLKDRLKNIEGQLFQQRVDSLLSQTASALGAGDSKAARTAIERLQSLAPNTPELPKLQADLEQLETEIAFQTLMRAMDQFAAADNWADAHRLARSGRQEFQTFSRFQQRADFIARVHRLITASSAILDAPDQLIKTSVQQQASALIDDAQTVQSFSPSLRQLTAALRDELAAYQTPLEVIVLSDTYTFVEVKSVGQVGTVAQKTIQLVPGDYLFIGKRKGYVTIQVPVVLRPGDSGKQISVIAHEQI